ncbi:hypothetical protein [Levilactobacillus brevis]|uniref:Uncharacterized protein n=2 Tax=Levilactobacillus brevis TaxID=1580 RepID=A0A0C1Q7H7_LEVBR|nr:hypothetical protein [Levilactobacillus brevis]AJA80960.1 hypothetical protein L747_06615 [Levilactobacillus brevis BSO 464]ANN49413.1 hypothetical protein A6F53_09200 [Levilactobacillus brevis]ARN92935.1 hypothetical protein AZI11_08480 [Levilactobacillus brevis]ARN95578.1 hypothetical protein AZI12_08530 [Levilactobacillus brevis]KID43818.1 hypothetical protein LbDm2_1274 [Levilactobacillus brevis]
MKILTSLLMVLLTGGLIGGTLWGMLTWNVAFGWDIMIGLTGLIVSTLVNLGLYWFLWPRSPMLLEDETAVSDEEAQKKPLR